MSQPLRTRRGDLQTAVDSWRSPTGRRVVLIGMMHVADKAFYDAVEARVHAEEAGGAAVHYECVRPPEPDENPSPAERKMLDRVRASGTATTALAALLNLQLQYKTAIPVAPSWRNTDMTILEMLRRLPDPERFVSRMESSGSAFGGDLDDDQRAVLVRFLRYTLRHLPMLLRAVKAWSWLTGKGRHDEDVIVVDRNQIAIAAALDTGSDVIALWGAAHLPGIGRGLRDVGFKHEDRSWLTAMAKPTPSHVAPTHREVPHV